MQREEIMQDQDIQIDDLAKYMFVDNEDTTIELDLDGVGSNKDLFCFLVDLLVKGIRILFAKSSGPVNLDDLSVDDLQYLQRQMRQAGIILNCNVIQNDMRLPPRINTKDIQEYANDAPLQSMVFQVIAEQRIYLIDFDLVYHLPKN
jgi:hypothetical protein